MARLLQLDDVNRLIGTMMSGLSTRYDLGSERDDVGRLIGDRPIGPCDADGPSLCHSLYDIMHDGMGVLLDASGDGTASDLVAGTRMLRCVPVATGHSMLIRPDACIAWAAEGNSTDGLTEALRRWFVPALEVGTMVRSDP